MWWCWCGDLLLIVIVVGDREVLASKYLSNSLRAFLSRPAQSSETLKIGGIRLYLGVPRWKLIPEAAKCRRWHI